MHGDDTATPVGVCVVCGNQIPDRKRRGPAYLAKRKACSQKCRAVLTLRNRVRREDKVTPPKVCEVCGNEFHRHPREALSAFAKRPTCGRGCANTRSNHERQLKLYGSLEQIRHCGHCGTLLVRRDGESFAKFMARQTCDAACGAKFMGARKRVPEEFKRGEYNADFYAMRATIRDRDGNACRICGALPGIRQHDIHHIDYDKSNAAERNLITLCRRCHTKTNYQRHAWMLLFQDIMREEQS